MHDSRAIARYLEKGLLKSIYIMPVGQQETRALYRCREAKVRDVTRCTNRVRSLLYYFGVQLPDQFKDKEYISKVFLKYLSSIELTTIHGTLTLQHYTCDLIYHRAQLLDVTRKLRKAILAEYGPSYYSILTVPGIGPITAMALLAETGSLERFRDPDDFVSYLGLIPAERSSGETLYTTRIQPRCNTHLRPILIEAAWGAIRKCPVMLAYFKRHAGISGKKSIVKVARKLVLIAKAVALHQTTYQPNYFEQKKVL